MPLRIVETLEENAYSAVKLGDLPALTNLVDTGLNVNHVFKSTKDVKAHGMTLLHVAVSESNVGMVRYLIHQGADVNVGNHCKDFDGKRTQVRAARYKDRLHLTCLFQAICSQNEEVIQLLIRGGADVNLYDRSGSSALWHSIDTNNSKISRTILNAPGCNVNLPDAFKMTPLHVAAVHKNPLIVQQLLEHGALLDPQQLQGATPLYIASRTENTEVVMILLQHGACPNIIDSDSISPLHVALDRSGSPELVNLLITAGAFVYSQYVLPKRPFDLLKTNMELRDYIEELLDTPRCLKILAALRIREVLKIKTRGKTILQALTKLPLPKTLVRYLILE